MKIRMLKDTFSTIGNFERGRTYSEKEMSETYMNQMIGAGLAELVESKMMPMDYENKEVTPIKKSEQKAARKKKSG